MVPRLEYMIEFDPNVLLGEKPVNLIVWDL